MDAAPVPLMVLRRDRSDNDGALPVLALMPGAPALGVALSAVTDRRLRS